MLYLVFILFIFYVIACCLDGPDLKLIWKKWLGNKLYERAKYFWPDLVLLNNYPIIEQYRVDNYDPVKLCTSCTISEMELYEQEMYGFNLRDEDPKEYCIKRATERCIDSLLHNLKESNFIKMHIDENPYNASINVSTELNIFQSKDYE